MVGIARSVCMLLVAAFLVTGCGARKAQPVIVRERVTLRGTGVTRPQPANSRTAITPSPQPAAGNRTAGVRDREEVGVTGVITDVPASGDAGNVVTPGEHPAETGSADSQGPTPSLDRATAPTNSTGTTTQEQRRAGSGPLILWMAIAAALCGWGVHLRRGARSIRTRTTRAA